MSYEIKHDHDHTHDHEHTHDGTPHAHDHSHAHSHDHNTHSHAHDSLHDAAQEHDHDHSSAGDEKETFALIRYMLSHNRHHAEELKGLADKLSDMGKLEAADILSEGISCFEKGNSLLESVVSLINQ